jgi:hypothetical protein
MDGSVDDINETLLGFLALPFGVLVCWGFYNILKNRWTSKETYVPTEDVLDGNLVEKNSDNQ